MGSELRKNLEHVIGMWNLGPATDDAPVEKCEQLPSDLSVEIDSIPDPTPAPPLANSL